MLLLFCDDIMNKLRYILKCIKRLDYKNMIRIAKRIARDNNKLVLFVLVDMVYCGFKYGAGYYDYQEFEFYLLNKKERETYLTRTKNNLIIKTFNKKDDFYLLDDKILFNERFNEYIKRDYLKVDNVDDFLEFTKKHKEFIAKPINGEGGKGIMKYEVNDNALSLFNVMKSLHQELIEEVIVQHDEINKLYAGAVNTLRLFTFNDGEDVYVLNSVFKIGNGGCTDNFSSGSMYTFVNDRGIVIAPAIDQEDNIYEEHPITLKKIIGFKVPFYKEACEMVKEASELIPTIKYVGWDVAITPEGPVIIEGNSFPGVFQIKPSLAKKKEGLIPKYKKYMDIDL